MYCDIRYKEFKSGHVLMTHKRKIHYGTQSDLSSRFCALDGCNIGTSGYVEHKTKTLTLFPLRKAPVTPGKFPFRDLKYYLNSALSEEEQVKVSPKKPRFGYMPQHSIQLLEASRCKPDL